VNETEKTGSRFARVTSFQHRPQGFADFFLKCGTLQRDAEVESFLVLVLSGVFLFKEIYLSPYGNLTKYPDIRHHGTATHHREVSMQLGSSPPLTPPLALKFEVQRPRSSTQQCTHFESNRAVVDLLGATILLLLLSARLPAPAALLPSCFPP